MNESHRLNADYFTIHGAKRDRSPDSSAEGTLANRSSLMGYDGYESDSDQDVNDIPNVIALLAVLRKASVDREKIVAVRTFLAQGGEELNYLADNMAEIMGLLIYQTSRAQLLDHLVEAINRTKDSQASDTKSEDIDQEMIDRKIDNLKRAMNASRTYLSGLDYWQMLRKTKSMVDQVLQLLRHLVMMIWTGLRKRKPTFRKRTPTIRFGAFPRRQTLTLLQAHYEQHRSRRRVRLLGLWTKGRGRRSIEIFNDSRQIYISRSVVYSSIKQVMVVLKVIAQRES